jgi:hypothetical protein
LFNRPARVCFIWKTRHAAPLFPLAIPSKIPAVDFIGKILASFKSSYRALSPRIAASPTFFAQTADGAALARVKRDTVKSPKTSFTSNTSATLCEDAKPSSNFRTVNGPSQEK